MTKTSALEVFAFAVAASLAACKPQSPAGTVLVDWTYTQDDASGHPAPTSKKPPQIVKSTAEWQDAEGRSVKLDFEIEIGDLAGDIHWSWPRHVHVTLAEPMRGKLPMVDCMPGPPGNKIVGAELVHPLTHEGVGNGVVACFFSDDHGSKFVYDIDGEGHVKRSVPNH